MSSQTWRYIPPFEASGAMQMAVDEWLLEQHRLGKMPSVLRFYAWKPAAISLGFHQRKYPEAWQNLTYQGEKIDLVRRPSGGRAVLHQGDLTYAIITSGMEGDRCQVYKSLCEFLIKAFRELGLELHYGDRETIRSAARQRNYAHHDNCFRTHTSADLVTNDGYKLIGSSQLRRKNAILQHGSIRLNPDPDLYEKIFSENLSPQPDLLELDSEIVIATLQKSLGDRQKIQLHEQPLTDTEWREIKPFSQNVRVQHFTQ